MRSAEGKGLNVEPGKLKSLFGADPHSRVVLDQIHSHIVKHLLPRRVRAVVQP